MSNYISSNNQQLLWKMAHQIPLFARLDAPKKEFEFKKVIEHFYRKYANRDILSVSELQQLNRETLSVFLPKSSTSSSTATTTLLTKPASTSTSFANPIQMVESRKDKSLRDFQERQNIYEDMNRKPDLPDPEEMFREKEVDDGKIQNMDDLILNYQKQREIDFNSIAPPVVLPSSKNTPVKLKLLDETILTENDVDDLDNSNSRNQSKKSVSWKPEIEIEVLQQPSCEMVKIESLEQKIKDLEKQNEKLERRMEFLSNGMEILLREKKKPISISGFSKSLQKEKEKEKEEPELVSMVLDDIIHKIEKMDNIKNKMKMFSKIEL